MKKNEVSSEEIKRFDTPKLTSIIYYWKDYDKNIVILSYLELQKRNFEIKDRGDLKRFESFLNFYNFSKENLENNINEKEIDEINKNRKENEINDNTKNAKNNKIINIIILSIIILTPIIFFSYKYISKNSMPKCEDPDAIQELRILRKMDSSAHFYNIRVEYIDKDSKSCGCNVDVTYKNTTRTLFYTLQKNTDGETYIETYKY